LSGKGGIKGSGGGGGNAHPFREQSLKKILAIL